MEKVSSFLSASVHSTGGAGPGSLANQLPRLTQETELQKMLSDERMRSEQHKTNFQALKGEHKRLQDDHMQLQNEIKVTIEEGRIVQEKYKSMYEQTKKELSLCHSEIEELRAKVMTPQRLEVVRLQVVEELEGNYRERFARQERELEELQAQLNQAKYELSFLKSEYEHEKAERHRVHEELRMQHEAEVSNLRRERDTTISRIQAENAQDSQKCRVLQRDNAQLHLKVKELVAEVEELRAQKEKVGFESETMVRSQGKQLAESAAVIKALEAERESLRRQVESLSADLTATGTDHNKMTGRIHELEKENLALRGQVDELQHKSKLSITDLRMTMVKERGDLERERDKLLINLEELQTQIELREQKIRQLTSALEEQERETVKRVQAAREDEFEKYSKLENEKFELETRLQELARRKIDDEAHRHAEQEKMEERVRAAESQKEAAQKEMLVFQTKVHHMEALEEQVERERAECTDQKNRVARLEARLTGFVSGEQEMTETNIKLRNQIELLQEELKLTQSQLSKIQDNHERIVASTRSSLMEDRAQLEQRVAELSNQCSNLHTKLNKTINFHKKHKKKSKHTAERLRDKVMLLEAQCQELELEKKALLTCVPQDVHNRLKKQWRDLYRRHQEFRAIILGSSTHQVTIGKRTFTTADFHVDGSMMDQGFSDVERQHQEDLKLLRKRLDRLGEMQTQQLQELCNITDPPLRKQGSLDDGGDLGLKPEKTDLEKATTSS